MKEDDKLVKMPTIEQEEFELFHYLMRDSAREDYAITLSWWKQIKGDLDSTCEMRGAVKWID